MYERTVYSKDRSMKGKEYVHEGRLLGSIG